MVTRARAENADANAYWKASEESRKAWNEMKKSQSAYEEAWSAYVRYALR